MALGVAVIYLGYHFLRRRRLKKKCDNCPLNKSIANNDEKHINKPV